MVKVLIISSRADYGGGPEHIYQLLENSSEDVKYFVACPKDEPYWALYSKTIGGSKIEIPHRRISLSRIYSVLKFLKENKIHIIHSHGKGAGFYGKVISFFANRPLVHTPHGIHIGQYNSLAKTIYLFYEKCTSFLVHKIIYVSNSEKEQAIKEKLNLNVSNQVIDNGVVDSELDNLKDLKERAKNQIKIDSNKFVVSSLSRFDFAKNMYEAFEIARHCKNYIFLFIGDGDQKNELELKAKMEGVGNIVFTGFTNNPQKYLLASDAYLSTSRWEGMPLGVLEAMSVGLPVIASDVTGNNEAVLNGETGFVYSLGDIESAISLLTSIVDDRNLYKRLSKESIFRQRSKYSVKIMTKKTEMLYKKTLCDNLSF